MRISTYWLRFCFCLVLTQLSRTGFLMAQSEPVAVDKKIPLRQALEIIEKKWHTKFAYEHDLLKAKFTTNNALLGATVEEVLKNVLYPNNLLFLYVSENAYSIVARDARFFQGNEATPGPAAVTGAGPMTAGVSQGHALRGQVIDEKGTAMPFVNIWVKGTHRGAQTGDRGDFTIADLRPEDSLEFTFVGYRSETIAAGRQGSVTVQLYATNKSTLDEVTVVSTGLQQLPKDRATGAFSTISGKILEQIPSPNIIQRLEGLIPGVKVNILSSDRSFIYGGGNQISLNGGTRTVGKNDYDMSIRGTSTLQGESFPLIVVDGAITEMDISTLNPDDIENISFLKDAAAASIWGIRAANGVMVITTRKGHISQAPSITFSANATVSERPRLSYQRTMNSTQMLGYEAELVQRGFLNANNIDGSSIYGASYYPNAGAVLALKLKAGTITQAAYNAAIDSMSAIDNSGQVQKYLLHPATNQEYNLAISGGNYNSNYYYSASYSKENPNTQRTVGQRLTLTMNNSWKLFRIATLSTSLRGSFFHYANNGMDLSSLYPNTGSAVLLPYMLLADNKGKSVSYDRMNPDFTASLPAGYQSWQYNYLDELRLNNNVQKDNNYSVNINLTVPLYKGISGSVQYSNERTFSQGRVFYDPNTYYYRSFINGFTSPFSTPVANSIGITSGGILNMINTTENNYALRGQLAYDRTLNRIHQINAIAGSEIRETNTGQGTTNLYGYNTETGFATDVNYSYTGYETIYGYNQSISGAPSQGDKRRRFLSYFSNASYTLLEKYTISGSARYDDYNNFGLNRKYRATPLWSSGLKWNLGKEHFMKDITWVDNLAIRATYGVNGNISTTTYPFTAISLSGNDYSTGLPGAYISSMANPELKWEKTYVTNLAVDFALFGNRLSGSVDYYRKNGKDLLYTFPINSAYAGGVANQGLTRNSASMTGRGVDIALNGIVMNSRSFTWNMGLAFSYNVNKLTENRFDTSTISSYYISYYPQGIGNLKGYSTDKLLVFRNAGLDSRGLSKVYDKKGDSVTALSPLTFSDLKYAGHTTAPFFGSWNTTLRYKHFSLYALLTYQFGGVFMKPSINTYITTYYNDYYSISGDIAKRWQQPGDELKTKVPGLNGTAQEVAYSLNRYQNSDINVLSSDYIRVREISLNYELPAAFMNKWSAKGGSIGLAVRNLGLLWKANNQGYDPDFVGYANGSYSLPASRSYNFSLKLNF